MNGIPIVGNLGWCGEIELAILMANCKSGFVCIDISHHVHMYHITPLGKHFRSCPLSPKWVYKNELNAGECFLLMWKSLVPSMDDEGVAIGDLIAAVRKNWSENCFTYNPWEPGDFVILEEVVRLALPCRGACRFLGRRLDWTLEFFILGRPMLSGGHTFLFLYTSSNGCFCAESRGSNLLLKGQLPLFS